MIEGNTILNQLSREDLTIQGLLLGVILLLVSFVIYLLRKGTSMEQAQREDAKENVKMINDITNVINHSHIEIKEVKEVACKTNDISKEILTIINERKSKL